MQVITEHATLLLAALLVFTSSTSGCVIRDGWPRHRVEVLVDATALGSSSDTLPQDGEALWLVYDAVELLPCADDEEEPELPPGFAHTLWRHLLVSEAHAHGPTTPTRQGVPHVIDVLRLDAPTPIAAFEPPPGRYCGLKLDFGPADQDAIGITSRNRQIIAHSVRYASHDPAMGAVTSARADHTFTFDEPWEFGTEDDQRDALLVTLDVAELTSQLIERQIESDEESRGRAILSLLPSTLALSVSGSHALSPPGQAP